MGIKPNHVRTIRTKALIFKEPNYITRMQEKEYLERKRSTDNAISLWHKCDFQRANLKLLF